MSTTDTIADFLGYRLGCAWQAIRCGGGAGVSDNYTDAQLHLKRELLRRTVGGFRVYPLTAKVIQEGERIIDDELPNRAAALQAILWAASNTDPADIAEAIDRVRTLLEDCNP